ncbi:MAG: hypothetical protein ACK5Q5_14145 [Planctomycetaceae bacterium]
MRLLIVTLLLICCDRSAAHAAYDDLHAQLELIRQGYLANRSAFTQGKCRFVYSIWSASAESDALAGKASDDLTRIEREHWFYFDGDAFTIKVDLDESKLKAEAEKDAGIIVPTTIARKGEYAIDHDRIINTAIVHSPHNWSLKVTYHPFNLACDGDVANPARSIEYAESKCFDQVKFEVSQETLGDGHNYLRLVESAAYNSHDETYWVDPARGYLPIVTKSTSRGPGASSEMKLLAVHEEHGAYFPLHAMRFTPRQWEDGRTFVQIREMKVLELDLSYVPTEEDLTIRLPKLTQYSDGINVNTSKTLYRNRKDDNFAPIHVSEIKGLYEQLQEIAAEREKEAASFGQVRDPAGTTRRPVALYWLAVINVGVVAVLVAIYFLRRKRASSS